MNKEQQSAGGIAIIGMSGRFPGAQDVESLWKMLCDGRNALREFSAQEIREGVQGYDYLSAPFAERQIASGNWVTKGYYLADFDKFDAAFFGYSPKEAELIDPQQRMFLESSWAALEDAGYVPDAYEGTVAVYGGTVLSRYFLNNVYANREIMWDPERDLTGGIGNEPDYLTNRVAYKLNLTGPSVTVQTACSTSLVAIHMACQALRNKECDLALAGGSIATVPGGHGYQYQEGSMSSADGLVRAFDANAKGTVFAEGGVGVIILKRLEDALADDDHIYAVVRGSAVTNDGNHKVGYTAPGVDGQVHAINRSLRMAGVQAEQIGYIEAHGTGTSLGDPIEISALTRAFRNQTARNGFCAIGSVKTNLGHLAPAAGVTSVIKAALAVQRGVLPPSLNYEQPNPRIDFANSPFRVNDRLQNWNTEGGAKRIAAVSSFGIGGTNAHLIMEQAPPQESTNSGTRLRLIVLSAKTQAALGRSAAQLQQFLQRHPETDLDDVAFTLQEGRRAFEVRAAIACHDLAGLQEKLQQLAAQPPKAAKLPANGKMAWLFTGQGSQYAGMARDLHDALPEFRKVFDDCMRQLAGKLEVDLAHLLLLDNQHTAPAELDAANNALRETRHAQPALFVVEYALACQLLAWKLEPDLMLGHSLGEYVAATLAGVFGLEEALNLVVLRGKLMQSMAPGAMLSIAADEAAVSQWLGGPIELAAVNSPRACVVCGPEAAIDSLAARLQEKEINCRKLQTSHAFHSSMMAPMAAQFRAAVQEARPQAPAGSLISNLNGQLMTAAQACDPEYWVQHLLSPVRFAAGLHTVLAEGVTHLLEVGPGGVLSAFARHALAGGAKAQGASAQAVPLMPHPQDKIGADQFLLQALGDAWAAGLTLAFDEIDADNSGRRISLPTYPFARERYWVDAPQEPPAASGLRSLKRSPNPGDWFHSASWRRQPWLQARPQLRDQHCLLVAPASACCEALMQALQAEGASVLRVEPGERFTQLDANSYALRPGNSSDWEQLVAVSARPDLILHTLLLQPGSGSNPLAQADTTLEYGFYSLLALVQAYADEASSKRIPLLCVSTELADVLPGETLDPVKASLIGAQLCLGHEYRRLAGAILDLPPALLSQPAQVVRLVLDELARLQAQPQAPLVLADKLIAYRHGARWLAGVEALSLPPVKGEKLAAEGAWLITGGLGGLGLEFAEVLVEHGVRQLALVGRSSLPDPATWNDWLAADAKAEQPNPQRAHLLRRLQRMQARGVQLCLPSCDISRADAVAAMVQQVQARFGKINGVVHAAGIAGSGVMALKTREQAQSVLAPKIIGVLALEQALQEQPPEVTILVSSLFATIGGVGQVDYAAANGFLDAYARSRSASGRRTLALAYGGWREVGMAVAMGHTASPGNTPAAPSLPEGRSLSHPYLFACQKGSAQSEFTSHLRAQDHWALQEHRINGSPVMPGTGLIELLRAAWSELQDGAAPNRIQPCTISDLFFYRPLFVAEDACVEVSLNLQQQGNGRMEADLRAEQAPVLSAEIGPLSAPVPAACDLAALRAQLRTSSDLHSQEFESGQAALVGEGGFLDLGPNWQVVHRIDVADGQLLAQLALAPALRAEDGAEGGQLLLHPGLLDMATGPITGHLLLRLNLQLDGEYLPFTYGKLHVFAALENELFTHVRYRGIAADGDTIHFDINLYAADGRPLLAVEDFRLRRVPAEAFSAKADSMPLGVDDGSISPQEGRALFWQALSTVGGNGHWIINPNPLDLMLERMRAERLAEGTQTSKKTKVVREDVVADAPTNPVEEALVAVIEEALGITPIGIHDNFFDLGIDSVVGIQVVSHAKKLGVLLKPNQLFEHQTVALLAAVAGSVAAADSAAAADPAAAAADSAAIAAADTAEALGDDDLDAVLDALGQS